MIYTPREVGPHMIRIGHENVPVEGSPFTCNVYDVGKILVGSLPKTCVLNQSVTFTVDASKAGEGTLELVVTTAKTSVRAEVSARSRGLYDVTFVPQDLLAHFINITFNEEHIDNSPFKCEVIEDSGMNGGMNGNVGSDAIKTAVRGRPAFVDVEDFGNNNIRILDPKGNSVHFEQVQAKGNEAIR